MERWQADLIRFGVFAAVAARPAYRALTAGRPARAQEWAAVQGLPLDDGNEAMVASYLRRSRRWRMAGALAGMVAGVAASTSGETSLLPLALLVTGYLAGVLAGELATRHEVRGSRRRASLSPRRLEEYVPPVGLEWMGWSAAGTVAAAVAFVALPRRDSSVQPAGVLAAAVAAVVFALGTRALAQRLLQRSQPMGSPAALAADDAIRSSGVRAVVAAGTAIAFVALSFECSALATTDVQVLRWTMGIASLVALGFGYGSWRTLVHPASWRVRRRPAAGNVA
jgi:hypothetical protein